MSQAAPFDRLAAAWVLTSGTRLIPGAGYYPVGAIAVVAANEAAAHTFINANREDLEAVAGGPVGAERVGDPWKRMREAAGQGLAGFQWVDASGERYMFMVRVEEAGEPLPTVLTAVENRGWGPSLTRSGVRPLQHPELLHWQRHDVLDPVLARWSRDGYPFRTWSPYEPFYELASAKTVVLLASAPLLGDWISPDGAFGFFTSREDAEHFRDHHLGDGANRMLLRGDADDRAPGELMAMLRPMPVHDLGKRLRELREICPTAAWVINPDGHREDSGYGFVQPGTVHPTVQPDGQRYLMRTVAGQWALTGRNEFALQRPGSTWSGYDTINWSRGTALQLMPLDRTYVAGPPEPSRTESEIDDEIDALFGSADLGSDHDGPGLSARANAFVVSSWDSVTGDGRIAWFRSALDAVRFFVAYERDHDRQYRSAGASSCVAVGFPGTADEGGEDLRSQRFQLGLRRIAARMLKNNYRPRDSEDLVALCNGTLRTLHCDYAGYVRDLLERSPDEQIERLEEELAVGGADWRGESGTPSPDPVGQRLAEDRMGEVAWELLLPKTKHFVATALIHAQEQGIAPQLDYAPIALEVTKALEVELADVVLGFRRNLDVTLTADPSDQSDTTLAKMMKDGKAPTIGSMSYLLKKPATPSPLRSAFLAYVRALPNGELLLSGQFRDALQRVIHKYRNGGVHESAIPVGVCDACIRDLVGHDGVAGLIARVASWK